MKPKVLIASKFYYHRGGDTDVAIAQEKLLRENGFETAVFAMDYPDNLQTPWNAYFAPQVEFAGGIGGKLRAAARIFGIGDVRKCFKRILDNFRPDIVHLHNIHSYLSPVLAEMAHARGIRVVWTLHDYKPVCPAYSCTYNGRPCEDCLANPRAVLSKRCMKGSLVASALAYLEARRWNRNRLLKCVDTFICPSAFMASMMQKGSFPANKLRVVCNFVDPAKLSSQSSQSSLSSQSSQSSLSSLSANADPAKPGTNASPGDGAPRDYYCYIGRLSQEKGIATLLAAAAQLPYTLQVAGDGPLSDELRAQYGKCANIRFLGRLDAAGVNRLLRGARFSVVPSECYENNPLSVIESLSLGTPVLGAEIGGIPELIVQPRDGLTFKAFDADDLREKIKLMHDNATVADNAAIAAAAAPRFARDAHLARLLEIYG